MNSFVAGMALGCIWGQLMLWKPQCAVVCPQAPDGPQCLSLSAPSPPPPAWPWMLDPACGTQRPRRTLLQRRGGPSSQTSSLSVGKVQFFWFLFNFRMNKIRKAMMSRIFFSSLPPSLCCLFCTLMLSEGSAWGTMLPFAFHPSNYC